MHKNRAFLKNSNQNKIDISRSKQKRGIAPPIQKPCDPQDKKISLVSPGTWKTISAISLESAIRNRKSRRVYTEKSISLENLSFLLWATQGMRKTKSKHNNFRTVPSAGCRHAIETYIAAFRVEGIEKGIYRYLPMSHELVEVAKYNNLETLINRSTLNQIFCTRGALTFIWTTIPERMEWQYAEASYKAIALDTGHICQNLYLACEAIGAGACALASYDQELIDNVIGLSGDEEFTIYLASVGYTYHSSEVKTLNLKEIPAEKRWDMLLAHISLLVSEITGGKNMTMNTTQALDLNQGFYDMGINDNLCIKFYKSLKKSLDCQFPFTILFKYPTVKQLS
ncbi:MAG: SagB family peptide dehydrogenase, partial [Candidatus Magnetomorum sp.]|nr:SagB family peptide dehydrogenase [Candidatus Magnetomorum sp.]